jgi:PAS domain S-box-containing protein
LALSQAEKEHLIACIKRDAPLPQEYCARLFGACADPSAPLLYNTAAVGLYRSALSDGRILACNQRTAELLGYASRESCLAHCLGAAHYVDTGVRESMLAQLELHGAVRNFDARLRQCGGGVIWARFNSRLDREEGVIEGSVEDVTALVAAEQRLHDTQVRFAQLFDTMINGFALHEIILGPDGRPCDYRFLEVNPAFERMTGLSAAELVGHTVLEVLPHIEPHWIEAYGKVALTGAPAELEDYSAALGKYFLVSAYAAGHGRFATVVQDNTARKLAQEALKQSEQRYRELVEQSQLPIVVLQDFRAVFANNALYRLLGYTDFEELRSIKLLDAVDPADHQRVIEYYAKLMQGEAFPPGVVLTLVAKDGRRVWVEATAELQEFAGQPAVQLALYDVTQRESVRRALQDSEQFLRAVLDHSPLGISVRSKTGRLLSYNPAWQRIWAIPLAEVEDDMAREREALVLDERDAYAGPWHKELLDLYVNGGSLVLAEARTGGRRPGAAEWVSQIFYAIPDAAGQVDRVVVLTQDITGRKRMEAALHEKETQARFIAENSSDVLWMLNLDKRRWDYMSPAVERLRGYSAQEALAQSVEQVVTPASWEVIQGKLTERTALFRSDPSGNHAYVDEIEQTCKDGSTVWTEAVSRYIRNDNGELCLLGISRNIAERKRLEAELRQQDVLYRRLVDTAGEGVWVMDENRVTTFVNSQMAQMLGLSPEAMLGHLITDFMFDEDLPEYFGRFAERQAGLHGNYEMRMRRSDGSCGVCRISATALLGAQGQFQGSFGMFTDITELKRAEQELRDSEERYRSLFENMLNGYAYCRMVYDELQRPVDFGYLAVNAAFERLTGLKNVVGSTATEVIPGIAAAHPELFEIYGRVASTGEPAAFEIDFAPLGLSLAISAYCPQPGYFAAVFNDITERRRSEIERETTVEILHLLNSSNDTQELLRAVVRYIKDWTGCEAVGIRLRNGEDYPYYETCGFPEHFVQLESKLCATDAQGNVVCDAAGDPVLECMCGNVLRGRFDPAQPFFTAGGSFWSSGAAQLLAGGNEQERPSWTRNRCIGAGYQSMALIPLRSGGETFGLIQLLDKRQGRFTAEMINLFERLGDNIAKALSEKLAKQALQESERSLQRSQQTAHIGHWTRDLAANTVKWSDEMYRIFGVDRDSYKGELNDAFRNAIHPEDREWILSRHQAAAKGVLLEEAEYRIVWPDGAVRHVWAVPGSAITDETGGVVRLSGVVQDITERKLVEQQLRESKLSAEASQARYEQVVNLISDVVWSLEMDAQGALLNTYISPAADRLLGLPPGTIGHDLQRYMQYVHPEDAGPMTQRLESVLRNLVQYDSADYRLCRPDGALLWVHTTGSAFAHADGRITAIGTTADITARKEVESKLIQAKYEWEATFDSVPDMIAIIDPQYKILRVNKAWETRLHLPLEQCIGRNCYAMMHNADSPPDACPHAQLMRDRKTHELTSYVELLDAHFQISCSPLMDQAGRFLGSVHTMRDISDKVRAEKEQQRLEDQLRQIQKLEALGTLAGGIAHDFNNILFAILGNAELLHEDLAPGSEAAEKLAQVIAASNRARDLVQQILAFSRRTQRELAPINMQLVVKEVFKLLRATLPSMIDLQLRMEPVSCVVLADASEMHQVLMNLATNAAQALEDTAGRLEITLRQCELSKAEVQLDPLLKPGLYVELTVRDNGMGMPPEVQQRIFEPFYTTKELGRGTGLGLAVVHGIISRLSGAVRVESALGQGTAFTVLLPALKQELVADAPRREQPPHGAGRILVVDDEPAIREVVCAMLSHLGYTVTPAASGAEALERFAQDAGGFELVLTDQAMPGMVGLELAKALTALNPRLPVLLCTGYSSNITPQAAQAAGVAEVLVKPVDMRQLALTIQRLLADSAMVPLDGDA